jgi:hypothetical protein
MLVNSEIRVPLRFEVGEEDLAFAAVGEEIDLARVGTPVGGELLAHRTDLEKVFTIWNIDHGDDPPAQFVVVTLATFGAIEFREAHPLTVVGRSNLCDGSCHDALEEQVPRTHIASGDREVNLIPGTATSAAVSGGGVKARIPKSGHIWSLVSSHKALRLRFRDARY